MPEENTLVTPPAGTRYSVLVEPGGTTVPALSAPAAYTQRGHTPNFDVSYDSSLGANGQTLADAVLGSCEADLARLKSIFGIASPGRFTVFIDPGTFGAYHFSCLDRNIHCAAFGGTDGDLENFLNCAEVDEVLMAAQAAGWGCGASAGEGLSRVLATELHPASLGRFASAARWLNSTRPDWVSQTEGTDRDYVSIGCATLFINYLRHQLRFSLPQIVQAGGTTLQQTHQRLTGSSNAFGPFLALVNSYFPPGTTVNLASDNPFPLSTVPDVLFLPAHAAAHDVVAAGLAPHFTGAGQQNSFVNSQTPASGKVVPGGSTVSMHLVHGSPP